MSHPPTRRHRPRRHRRRRLRTSILKPSPPDVPPPPPFVVRSRQTSRLGQRCWEVGMSREPMRSLAGQQACVRSAMCLAARAFAKAIGRVPSAGSTTTLPSMFARISVAKLGRAPQWRARRCQRCWEVGMSRPLLRRRGATVAGGPGQSVGSRMIGNAPIARTTTTHASRFRSRGCVSQGSRFFLLDLYYLPFTHCWGRLELT